MFDRIILFQMLGWIVCVAHIAIVDTVPWAQYLMPEIEFESKFPLTAFAALSAVNNNGYGGGGGAANLNAIGSPLLSFNDAAFSTLAGLSQLAQIRTYGTERAVGFRGQPLLTSNIFSGGAGILPAVTEPLTNKRQQPQHLEQHNQPRCMFGTQTPSTNNAQEAHIPALPVTTDSKQQSEVLTSPGTDTLDLAAKYVVGTPSPSNMSGAANNGQRNPSSSTTMKVLLAWQHDPSASMPPVIENKINNVFSSDLVSELFRLVKSLRQRSETGV